MTCFVNLPVRYTQEQPEYLTLFLRENICPELGLDRVSLLYPEETHQAVARRFHDAGLPVAVHLPFLIRDESEQLPRPEKTMHEMLVRGARIAALYGAAHMIGHTQYIRDGKPRRLSQACWSDVLSVSGDIPLFLENIWEESPESLLETVRRIPKPGAGICFDIGHWHAFSQGYAKKDMEHWMRVFAPKLRCLHLHDNDGSHDAHAGLGCGTIPWKQFFALLHDLNLSVSVTYEPHQKEALLATKAFFAGNPHFAAILGHDKVPL